MEHSEIAHRTSGKPHPTHKKPHVDKSRYQELYEESIKQPHKFWDKMAKEHLHFHRPYHTVRHGGFQEGDIAWFVEGGKLRWQYF